MSEASQSKLLNDASDLRKTLTRARDVLRGMETERETAKARLAKMRDVATAQQLKLDVLNGDCKKIEQQVARLDAEIKSLSDMLTQFTGLGDARPATLPQAPVSTKPVPAPKVTAKAPPKRTAEQVVNDSNLRRLAIIEACTTKPRTMPELREIFPKIPVENLRPIVSLMVKDNFLKVSGSYGTYQYARGARAAQAPAATSISDGSAIGVGPSDIKKTVTAPAPKASVEDSLRENILKMVLAGPPRSAADFYSVFPKANRHTIQSALSHLAEQGKVGRLKSDDDRFFKYCAPGTKAPPAAKPTQTATVTQADRVLAICKSPMKFGELAQKLPDINRHVLHQTVHALVHAKRLRTSGKRTEYVYETVS